MASSTIKNNLAVETKKYTSGSTTIVATRVGKTVSLSITGGRITSASQKWVTLATLDAQYRPSVATPFMGYDNETTSWSSTRPIQGIVRGDGKVDVYAFSDKLAFSPQASVSYIAANVWEGSA